MAEAAFEALRAKRRASRVSSCPVPSGCEGARPPAAAAAFGDERRDRGKARLVVLWADHFQGTRALERRLANRYADALLAEIECQHGLLAGRSVRPDRTAARSWRAGDRAHSVPATSESLA